MKPLADDTSLDIERRQIDAWRAMTPAQKVLTVAALSRGLRDLAMVGIRKRYPTASDREQFLRLAILTLGRELAAEAYPDIDRLGLE